MKGRFTLILAVSLILTIGFYLLLTSAGVDGRAARYIAGVAFLVTIGIAGQFYLPAQNKLVFWAVLAGATLSLFFNG